MRKTSKIKIRTKKKNNLHFLSAFVGLSILLTSIATGVVALNSGQQFRNMGAAYTGDQCTLPQGGMVNSNTCGCEINVAGKAALYYCLDGEIGYNPGICESRCALVKPTATPAPIGTSCGNSVDNESTCNDKPVGFDCSAGPTGDRAECVQNSDAYGSWCVCQVTQKATKISCGLVGMSDSYCKEHSVNDSCGNSGDNATCKALESVAGGAPGCRCINSNGQILTPVSTPTPTVVPLTNNSCNDLTSLPREELPQPGCENRQVGQNCDVEINGRQTSCVIRYSSRQLPYCACVINEAQRSTSANPTIRLPSATPTTRSISPTKPVVTSPLNSPVNRPKLPTPTQRVSIFQRILSFFGL